MEGTLKDHLIQPHPLDVSIQQPSPWHSESLQCQRHHHICGETNLVNYFSPCKNLFVVLTQRSWELPSGTYSLVQVLLHAGGHIVDLLPWVLPIGTLHCHGRGVIDLEVGGTQDDVSEMVWPPSSSWGPAGNGGSSTKVRKIRFWVQFSLVLISGCDRSSPILTGRARGSPLTPKAASPPG